MKRSGEKGGGEGLYLCAGWQLRAGDTMAGRSSFLFHFVSPKFLKNSLLYSDLFPREKNKELIRHSV